LVYAAKWKAVLVGAARVERVVVSSSFRSFVVVVVVVVVRTSRVCVSQ